MMDGRGWESMWGKEIKQKLEEKNSHSQYSRKQPMNHKVPKEEKKKKKTCIKTDTPVVMARGKGWGGGGG